MHTTRLRVMLIALILMMIAGSPATAFALSTIDSPAVASAPDKALRQQMEPGRGDDLARIQQWRTFLDRAFRAFTAAKMSTADVKAKIEEADQRIEELQDDRGEATVGRSDITGDVGFLERAVRAFTAAKMSTTDVKRWLEEAKEEGGVS